MSYFFYEDGYIAYKKIKKSISVLGDPVISDLSHKDCLHAFIDSYPNACFYHIQDHTADVLAKYGFNITDIGPQHFVDLQSFTGTWGQQNSLRSGVNKAKRRHISVIEDKPSHIEAHVLMEIHTNWVKKKHNPYEQAFLSRPLDFLDRNDCRYFFAYDGDTVIGYYFFTPLYEDGRVIGYYADNCRYLDSAPKGVSDLLAYTALTQFKRDGYKTVGMGLCPFSEANTHPYPKHRVIPLLLKFIYTFNLPRYGYKGIHHYTQKFHGKKTPCFMASRSKVPLQNLYRTWQLTCRTH